MKLVAIIFLLLIPLKLLGQEPSAIAEPIPPVSTSTASQDTNRSTNPVEPTETLEATDVIKSGLIKLIYPLDGKVVKGGGFIIQTPPGIECTITPTPLSSTDSVQRGTNNNLLTVFAAEPPGYTIEVNKAIIHPTMEEWKVAPRNDEDAFADWMKKTSVDEIYRDSLEIKVGGSPNPGPEPGPEPEPVVDLTEFGKQVYELAKGITGTDRKTGIQTVAGNYATLASSIGAGAYNSLDLQEAKAKIISDIFERNFEVSEGKPQWQDFFKKLGEIISKKDQAGELKDLQSVRKIFQEIQAGLEASL